MSTSKLRTISFETDLDCSVPVGVLVDIAFLLLIPRNFPYDIKESKGPAIKFSSLAKLVIERIDFLGAFFLLAAFVFLVAALENAGLRHPWSGPLVSAMLAVSGVLWVLFLIMEWKLTRDDSAREPVFPWRFVQSRVVIGLFL